MSNLVPTDTQYHRDRSISTFVETPSDKHAREHGEFFISVYKEFEKNLNELKREIQIEILHEKHGKGEQITNTT